MKMLAVALTLCVQVFNPNRSVNRAENLERCFGCHKGQQASDFTFTADRMKSVQ